MVWLFATPRTAATPCLLWPLPGSSVMEFSRQEYWSGWPSLSQWIFLTQGLNPGLLHLLHWKVDSFMLVPPGKLISSLVLHFLFRSQTWSSQRPEENRPRETDSSKVGSCDNEGLSRAWTLGFWVLWWDPATHTSGRCAWSFCSREVVPSYRICSWSQPKCQPWGTEQWKVLETTGCRNLL